MIRSSHVVRAALLAALFPCLQPSPAWSAAARHRIGLVVRDHVVLRAKPSSQGRVLAHLVQQTQVEVLGRRGSWTHVAVWASVRGWIPSGDITYRKPWDTVSTYQPPEVHYTVGPHKSEHLHAAASLSGAVTLYSSPGGRPRRIVRPPSSVTVSAWQQDGKGKIWYQIQGGWAPGDAILLLTPDPGLQRSGRTLIWQRAAGKGMWLTLGTIADSAPDALARAAQRDGITHIYLEAAISPLGFHGKDVVGPLIDAAHRRKIEVIAWVFPYLYDLASDIELTRRVASFRTPVSGSFDGIAADLERNVTLGKVRAYSQLVRAYLGPSYLLVGVTYSPQASPNFPFAEVARQYNLIAPMDYWHQTKTSTGLDYGHLRYGYSYGYRYASDSVTGIGRLSGHVPVAPIGQSFDNFGRLEMGPHAPSAGEINGFLAGTRRSGGVGASFFQWMTTTVDEWRAIHDFRF